MMWNCIDLLSVVFLPSVNNTLLKAIIEELLGRNKDMLTFVAKRPGRISTVVLVLVE